MVFRQSSLEERSTAALFLVDTRGNTSTPLPEDLGKSGRSCLRESRECALAERPRCFLEFLRQRYTWRHGQPRGHAVSLGGSAGGRCVSSGIGAPPEVPHCRASRAWTGDRFLVLFDRDTFNAPVNSKHQVVLWKSRSKAKRRHHFGHGTCFGVRAVSASLLVVLPEFHCPQRAHQQSVRAKHRRSPVGPLAH